MCTVTFLPVHDKYIITSNRDEKIARKPALPPKEYKSIQGNLIYPKDVAASGSWIAMHENGNTAVLLNGAFVKHQPNPPYDKSRGIVFLDIISNVSPVAGFYNAVLLNIEPFTIIIFDNNKLYDCRWDGNKKHVQQIKTCIPHIWSSATLYDAAVIQKRRKWFENWLKENPAPSQQDIMNFHQFGGEGDIHNDLCMNRNNSMLTVSVTSMEINSKGGIMKYLDLSNNKHYRNELHFSYSLAI